MVNINMFFSQPSRFQAIWEGPATDEAVEWLNTHPGTNDFIRSGYTIWQKNGPGGHVMSGANHVNFPALRAANQAYNDEVRRKHEADSELDTGTDVKTIATKWFMLTKGQKLRTIAWQRNMYLHEIGITNERKNACFEAVRRASRVWDGFNEGTNAAGRDVRKALSDAILYLSVMTVLSKLEQMVKDETEEGWDWKMGLRAQLDERHVLFQMIEGLSVVARNNLDAATAAFWAKLS